MTDFIEIEIDGKKIQANPQQTVIQAADEAGIYIPRFCYHKNLSIVANCRMCLVDVERSPKPMPACALPLAPGMKVFTKSTKALSAQRAVMEFLLINHPLDCPICDQGGECELQDLAMGYGAAKSHFCENKRAVADEDIGPLVSTEMTRCIQCTRCVRFGDEVAGLRELGAVNRGEEMEITTYVKHALHSEVSGNIIDLCPVGALTAKPSRFRSRAWELLQSPAISPHDCVGANINVHTRQAKVMRVVSRENPTVNKMWIADRDRFSYEGLYHPDRLTHPLVKLDGVWEQAEWLPSLDYAVGGLRRVMATSTGDQLGALISPNSTVEEIYLLQKIMRGLGSSNIDHRIRQNDFRDQTEMPFFPGLNVPLEELDTAAAILLVGSTIHKEQPLLGLRCRKAFLNGATMMAINMLDYRFHFGLHAKKIVGPGEMVQTLAAVAKALNMADAKLKTILENVTVDDTHTAIAEKLKQSKKGFILLGSQAFNHPQASILRRLSRFIAEATGHTLVFLTDGANAAGAWMAGAVPHRRAGGKINTQIGLNATAMLEKNRKGYVLLNIEPDLDCANPVLTKTALKQADFVVAFSVYKNPLLEEVANVILPIAPFTETSGTYVNITGAWQSFKAAASLYKEAQPAWKALCSMANLFQLPGFRYETTEAIREELLAIMQNAEVIHVPTNWKDVTLPAPSPSAIFRIGEVPLYAVDGIVRRAQALQVTQKIVDGELAVVRLHPVSGQKWSLREGEVVTVKQKNHSLPLPVKYDARVPPLAVWIASGIPETSELSELFGTVELVKG